MSKFYWLFSFWTLFPTTTPAQRVAVLNQIDLPHNYYFREMYLPQLTSGPSGVDWMPDGKSVIYSMAGNLWMQALDSDEAKQMTDDVGYDYQPDVSPDGQSILFVRYSGASMDVMLMTIADRKTYLLTDGKSVSLEPRWSPDGQQVAFVTTQGTAHFLTHIASVADHKLEKLRPLLPDRKSETKRYYYSAFDHSIHPAWSRDGKSIYLVNNQEVVHGTGNLVSVDVASGQTKLIQSEETNWRLRPDVSPDGTRMVYSSYLGQNWHQLWMIPTQGGYPVPITYGDYDKTAPRWSPDGKKIAYISNRGGNTSLWILDAFTGSHYPVSPAQLTYFAKRVPMTITTTDEQGNQIPSRISVTDGKGRFYAPREAWIHADDSKYPNQQTEARYFHSQGSVTLMIPKDSLLVTATRGPMFATSRVKARARQVDVVNLNVKLNPLQVPDAASWHSADMHVHMNYGGNYRNIPSQLAQQAAAEDLNFVYNLIVNKEQRVPDVAYFTPASFQGADGNVTITQGQEFHTSPWGHMSLINLQEHLIVPIYSAYAQTALASYYPHNSVIADAAHSQKGLAGYVHPFDPSEFTPDQSASLTNMLPVDAALRKADYCEIVSFADHKATAMVWYHLLNTGIKIPAAAGTDAMANFASLRGPVGLNRVYVKGSKEMTVEKFQDKLLRGKSFVTNGPLCWISVEGLEPGDSLNLERKKKTLSYKGWLRSNVPVDAVEVVYNGQIVATHTLGTAVTSLDISGKIPVKDSGWILLRASAAPHPDVFDLYPYATTNPVFLFGGSKSPEAAKSAAFFIKWTERLEKFTRGLETFRDESERSAILSDIARAKAYFQTLSRP